MEIPDTEKLTRLIIDGEVVELDAPPIVDSHGLSFSLNHRPFRVEISAEDVNLDLLINHTHFLATIKDERQRLREKFSRYSATRTNSVGEIKASMAGLIINMNVAAGDKVSKGKSLIIMEAMKMENEISSPIDGNVIQCLVMAGQTVNKGQLLMIIK